MVTGLLFFLFIFFNWMNSSLSQPNYCLLLFPHLLFCWVFLIQNYKTIRKLWRQLLFYQNNEVIMINISFFALAQILSIFPCPEQVIYFRPSPSTSNHVVFPFFILDFLPTGFQSSAHFGMLLLNFLRAWLVHFQCLLTISLKTGSCFVFLQISFLTPTAHLILRSLRRQFFIKTWNRFILMDETPRTMAHNRSAKQTWHVG